MFKIVYNLEFLLELFAFLLPFPRSQESVMVLACTLCKTKQQKEFFSSLYKSVLGRDLEYILVFCLLALLVICCCFHLRTCSGCNRVHLESHSPLWVDVGLIADHIQSQFCVKHCSIVPACSGSSLFSRRVSMKLLSVPTAKQ